MEGLFSSHHCGAELPSEDRQRPGSQVSQLSIQQTAHSVRQHRGQALTKGAADARIIVLHLVLIACAGLNHMSSPKQWKGVSSGLRAGWCMVGVVLHLEGEGFSK